MVKHFAYDNQILCYPFLVILIAKNKIIVPQFSFVKIVETNTSSLIELTLGDASKSVF